MVIMSIYLVRFVLRWALFIAKKIFNSRTRPSPPMIPYSQHSKSGIRHKPSRINHMVFSTRNTSQCCASPSRFFCACFAPSNLNGGRLSLCLLASRFSSARFFPGPPWRLIRDTREIEFVVRP